ncbi:MAG TPA: HAD hydrolase-like protein [Pseudobdellovibrionaceae bacterium]|nr:HAD hydrolase-like protein [Pseudobdellovibrionaceae bacterium]
MVRLLCFDLDGTLVDSAGDIVNAVNRTLIEFDKEPLSHDLIVSHIGEGLRVLLQGVFSSLPEGMTTETLVERFLSVYEEEMLKTTVPFAGVDDFLDGWVANGGLIGIITNKNEAPARRLIEHLGFYKYPWVDIFGADTLAERKPSALPLQTMMKKARVSETETLMIGDGTPDLVSAKAAGVRSVAVEFGYSAKEILSRYHPTTYLTHYQDLRQVVQDLSRSKS